MVAEETTESTLTYANPDGTITLEASSGPARIKQDDAWTPVDTTLVAAEGLVRPKATLGRVEISGGGSGRPLVKLAPEEDKEFAVSWPKALPVPTLAGNKATFTDAAGPGADLVVTALSTGVRQEVVLRQRPAESVEFVFPLHGEGLTLSETRQGGLRLADDKGKVFAAAPRPVMSGNQAVPPGQARSPETQSPPTGAVDTKVTTTSDGRQVLVLKPDPDFLLDPATTYPVTVDSAVTLPLGQGRAINSPCPDGDQWLAYKIEVSLTDWTCSDWSAKVFYRSLLSFDAAALAGQAVTNARLELVGDLWGCPTDQRLQIQRITGAWNTENVFWSSQPAVTTAGQVTSTPPSICTPNSSPAADVPWSIAVTEIAQAWATGAAGHGLMLRATTEDKSRPTFAWDFRDGGADAPKLVVTFGATPWVEHLRTVPVASPTRPLNPPVGQDPQISGRLFTTTTTPTLHAGVRGTAATLRADFEVEHDPSAGGQGSGLIWSGSADDVRAGEVAKVTIPQGVLSDGWRLRWRSRAVDGTLASAWSQWQSVNIDATPPAAPEVWCSFPYAENSWGPRMESETECGFGSTSKDVTEYIWGVDLPFPIELEEAGLWEDSLGESRTIEQYLSDGWHTIYVKTRDKAHNTSPTVSYSFGVGPGGLVTAQKQTRTHRLVTLDAAAPPSRTAVTYEYATSSYPWATWQQVPAGDVFVPGTGTPIAGWPLVRTNTAADFPGHSWDLAKTLKDIGGLDGAVQLRACFSGGSSETECSRPVEMELSRSALGGTHATQDLGPGTVALLNGDFSMKVTDAGAFGVELARTHRSLDPSFEPTVPAEAKVFGPGWQASFPATPSWVAEFTPSDHGNAGWIQLLGPDGSTYTYTKDDDDFVGIAEASDGSRIATSGEQLVVTDPNGAKTTYIKVAGSWVVARTEKPATDSAITYQRDTQGRITRILSPVSDGVSCGATLTPGCRALTFSYATSTTATGVGSGWGDVKDQIASASLVAFDPESNAMRTTVLASYEYDSTGHLRRVTDPRTGLAGVYYYTGEGRVSQLTPPGQAPWQLAYDTRGRLAHVQREEGTAALTTAVAYDVPIAGTGAPLDLTATQTTKWGQAANLPVTGAAVFPASHVPVRGSDGTYSPSVNDWAHGSLTYMDVNGRPVNAADFGAGAWQISATQYNDLGNVVWSLSPSNRAQALAPGDATDPYVAATAGSAERAYLLADLSTFSQFADLLEEVGPTHTVQLASGELVSARRHTTYTYDEGKPTSDVDYSLVTTSEVRPSVVDGTVAPGASDVQTTRTGYDPIRSGDTSGWTLRAPTSVTTVMPGQADIVRRTRYDSSGRTIESRMPASNGTDAGAILTSYYTAGPHPSVPACGNRPQWAGMQCHNAPAAQPAGTPIPAATMSHGYYGQLTTKTETSGSTTRTTTSSYDAAGRLSSLRVEVSPPAAGGVAVPDITYGYDAATGSPTTVSAGGKSITTTHDALGRVSSQTDAGGGTSTFTYDAFGRTATVDDGKGTVSMTYDGVDAAGRAERRGKPTQVAITGVATFGYAYDADGRLTTESLPGGLTVTSSFDNAGAQTGLEYGKNDQVWLNFTEQSDVMSRVVRSQSPADRQQYAYDAAGRLTEVQDTYDGTCATRQYGFDRNSNRTSFKSYPGAQAGACSTSATPTTTTYTYDAADRITGDGYTYDDFGRVTTAPGTHMSGGTALTSAYHANDVIASLTQAGRTQTFALDPLGRVVAETDSAGTATHHYSSSADTPSWTAEADGSWTRYLNGPNGLLATQASNGHLQLQLANLHGDIVATADPGSTGITSYTEYTEFGSPRETPAGANRYGWLGTKQRSADTVGDVILMGVRVYNPVTGRMLQSDPVQGGCANRQDYALQDPVNGRDLDGRECYGATYQVFDDARFQSCATVASGVYSGMVAACAVACTATLGVGCAPCFGAATIWYAGAISWCRANAYKTCCKEKKYKKVYDKVKVCVKKNKKGQCVATRSRDKDTYRLVAYAGPEVCWW
ncbi:DNRLRE domain-containing protein [Nonomuraea sp. MG754425]|uniref:DNRLRE domain-containing protein n=1 Tax=Nonomuraea sp. MG754425 TaxID=2570319 RepID=UPI001F1AE903|nr:DNRLRE domain-containing protein [Nonomuraea sp. MG754425]